MPFSGWSPTAEGSPRAGLRRAVSPPGMNPPESRGERLKPTVKRSAATAPKRLHPGPLPFGGVGKCHAPIVMLRVAIDRGRRLSSAVADVLNVVINGQKPLAHFPLENFNGGRKGSRAPSHEIQCAEAAPQMLQTPELRQLGRTKGSGPETEAIPQDRDLLKVRLEAPHQVGELLEGAL